MLAVRTLAASAAASAPVQARGVASAAPEPRLQPRHHEDGVAQRLGAPGLAAAMSSGQDRELQDQLDQLQEHEVRLPVPWGHIAGKWWGRQDRRPLVALHGWGDNAGSFQRLAGSLRGVPVLALDLPGHGLSSHPPRGLAPADRGLLLAALRRVHRALGLTAMSLVGHSLGDALALLYAATYPAEVDMYVSLDTLVPCPVGEDAVVKSSGPLTDELLEVEMTLDRKVEPKSPSPHPESLPFLLSTRGGSLNRHAAGMLLQRGVASGGASTLDPRVVRAPVLDTALALACARAVRCPTLCVLPEWRAPRALAADPELRARFLAELRMAAKSVATVSVTGTHHVHLNSPEVVVPALCDFLDQHYCRQEHAVPTATFAV